MKMILSTTIIHSQSNLKSITNDFHSSIYILFSSFCSFHSIASVNTFEDCHHSLYYLMLCCVYKRASMIKIKKKKKKMVVWPLSSHNSIKQMHDNFVLEAISQSFMALPNIRTTVNLFVLYYAFHLHFLESCAKPLNLLIFNRNQSN